MQAPRQPTQSVSSGGSRRGPGPAVVDLVLIAKLGGRRCVAVAGPGEDHGAGADGGLVGGTAEDGHAKRRVGNGDGGGIGHRLGAIVVRGSGIECVDPGGKAGDRHGVGRGLDDPDADALLEKLHLGDGPIRVGGCGSQRQRSGRDHRRPIGGTGEGDNRRQVDVAGRRAQLVRVHALAAQSDGADDVVSRRAVWLVKVGRGDSGRPRPRGDT